MKKARNFHAVHASGCGGIVELQCCGDDFCDYADVGECLRCGELFAFPCPVHTPETTST